MPILLQPATAAWQKPLSPLTVPTVSIMRLQDYRSALIVKPSSLGDIVHTLPAVHALKLAHPELRLRWVAKPEWVPLLAGAQDVDEVIPFPQKELSSPLALWRWLKSLRALPHAAPELVLDFQGLLRSAVIARSSGSRPIWGLSDAREGSRYAYDHVVQVDAGAHAVDRYLTLVKALGVAVQEVQFHLPLGEPVEQPLPQRFIALHPYSRGEGKSLSTEVLQALLAALAPLPVVLVGVWKEHTPYQDAHVLDLVNATTLGQLISVLRASSAVVSVDSGPMHLAAAVQEHTLGIHTWSDPRKVGPYSTQAAVWKVGRIAPRTAFTAEECAAVCQVTLDAVPALATWARAAVA